MRERIWPGWKFCGEVSGRAYKFNSDCSISFQVLFLIFYPRVKNRSYLIKALLKTY